VTAMKSDLRNLVSAEESFFSDSAKYTTNLTSLNLKACTGVTSPPIVTYAGAWQATHTHTQLPGKVCRISVNTTNPSVTTAGEGEPACP